MWSKNTTFSRRGSSFLHFLSPGAQSNPRVPTKCSKGTQHDPKEHTKWTKSALSGTQMRPKTLNVSTTCLTLGFLYITSRWARNYSQNLKQIQNQRASRAVLLVAPCFPATQLIVFWLYWSSCGCWSVLRTQKHADTVISSAETISSEGTVF